MLIRMKRRATITFLDEVDGAKEKRAAMGKFVGNESDKFEFEAEMLGQRGNGGK